MKAMDVIWIPPALALLGACGSTTMALAGPQFPPREPQCEFRMLTAMPASGVVEVAAIDVNWGAYGSHQFRDINDFKNEIRPYVCKAGGDAAIASANGYGMYIKATVLKTVEGMSPAAAQASQAGPAIEATDTGCRYDTQCKGDRVCVQGTCMAPGAAPTSPATP